VLPLKITSRLDCSAVAHGAIETFGRVDVLVNTAGFAPPVAAEELNPALLRRVIDNNLVGTINVT
jgi:NAD(P)-dependent dehydrogenase (short-subunit alcohol dehydrogenase family)